MPLGAFEFNLVIQWSSKYSLFSQLPVTLSLQYTTWHHKLSGFQSILHLRYREMIGQFPNLKCIFPEAPSLSFRRNKNLRNRLVHTSLTIGTQKTSEQSGYSTPCLSKRGKSCKLCPFMSNTNVITNKLSHILLYVWG